MSELVNGAAEPEFCYLTTTGRKSGRPRTVEMWFAVRGRVLYMLAGGGAASQWVKNLSENPQVDVRIGEREMSGTARLVQREDEDEIARRLLAAKYEGWSEGQRLSGWASSALPVAVDLLVGRRQNPR